MIPLSTLIEVLKDYDNDPSFDPDCAYDIHLLASFILMQSFEKMQKERLPAPSQLIAATVVLQSWCSQEHGRWTTTYWNGSSYITEIQVPGVVPGLEEFGEGTTMAESIIKAAEKIKL